MIIVDAHQDIAWNMLTYGRDYTRSAEDTRRLEAGGIAPQTNGNTLLGWTDYQKGQVGLVFATLFAAPLRYQHGEWDVQCYDDDRGAADLYRRQLDVYQRLVDDHPDKFCLVQNQADLDQVLASWSKVGLTEAEPNAQVGLVILMEGAEGVRDVGELERWWAGDVRLIGPAWAGNRFCGGTREPGGLTPAGYALLDAMASYGFALDLSHMDEAAALQALDIYPGVICATHSNAKALLKGSESNRHLTDRTINGILERDGVIGVVPYNQFLLGDWRKGDPRQRVTLMQVVAQIDYICQLAGDAQHVGLGTDFDGGFGLESVPFELDTIADLRKLEPLLLERGYSQENIDAILGGNWIERLRKFIGEG